MRILLSNDDGYQARGLRTLAEHLAEIADVTIVAPDRNRSGASNSLTLDTPLRVEQAEENVYYVNGTPTDCVHIAITGLLAEPPDMLISGSNHGENRDRGAVAEFAAQGAEILGDDPAAARATAERKWDRTPGTEPAVQMANQLGTVFAKLDCTPRWRERLSELAIPALVVHGRRDPFFPVGNGEALAREIPGARLLVLERAATAIPDAAADEVAAAMLVL